MKACPTCGELFGDEFAFCAEDGSELDSIGEEGSAHAVSAGAAAVETSVECPIAPNTDGPGDGGGSASSLVLRYCPACAAEYPLTFTTCPLHGVELTTREMPRFVTPPVSPAQPVLSEGQNTDKSGTNEAQSSDQAGEENGQAAIAGATIGRARSANSPEPARADALNAAGTAPLSSETPALSLTARPSKVAARRRAEGRGALTAPAWRSTSALNLFRAASSADQADGEDEAEKRLDGPGLRLGAWITAAFLLLFLAGAAFAILSTTRGKPQTGSQPIPAAQASLAAPAPAPLIATPQEAQDYTESATPLTPPAGRAKETDPSAPTKNPAREQRELRSLAADRVSAPRQTDAAALHPRPEARPEARPSNSSPSLMETPRWAARRFDARLVRIRSHPTPAGMRYDLTFALQDQGGPAIHWDRLSVATQTTSGRTRNEAIPFSHYLGPSGSLTFTVSVEMPGRSAADWQGRVVCTGVGADASGQPVRASFSAIVSP